MATPPTISQGATGPTVRWAQYLLVRRTLSDGQIDGIFGAVTKAGVEQFQRDSHLAVDGVVGPATWAALGGDGPQPPMLADGSRGPVVRAPADRAERGPGQLRAEIQPGARHRDGTTYGPQTATAVRGTQQQGHIEADGTVGLQTWALPVHAVDKCSPTCAGIRGPGGG